MCIIISLQALASRIADRHLPRRRAGPPGQNVSAEHRLRAARPGSPPPDRGRAAGLPDERDRHPAPDLPAARDAPLRLLGLQGLLHVHGDREHFGHAMRRGDLNVQVGGASDPFLTDKRKLLYGPRRRRQWFYT